MDSVTGPRGPQWRPPRRTGGAAGSGGTGPPGPAGPAGPAGTPGVGVPAGGTTGQVLEKRTATDYDTIWGTVSGGGGGTATAIGPTPPPSPVVGQMWWRSSDGVLFVYYDDGSSQQWVPATPTVKGDAATQAYRYVQASAATVWTITHGLGFRPNVTAVDSTGQAMWPGTLAYTATTVTLTFSAAVGGEAYLS